MKKTSLSLLLLISAFSYAQIKETQKEENLKQKDTTNISKEILIENATLACDCIEKIDGTNKTISEKSTEVKSCIDEQVIAYQTTTKLSKIDKEETGDVDINIAVNPDSKEYQAYYYELERQLMSNCSSLTRLINSNDIEGENSFSQNPIAVKAYNNGIDFLAQKNFQKALPYFQKAVKIDSNFAFAWDNIGVIQRNLGNYDEAIEAYKTSIALNDQNKTPVQNMALVYMFQKKYKKAIRAYKKLTKLDENDPEAFYGIANAYLSLGDYKNGLNNMCEAYQLYVSKNSPYRSDAEKIIGVIYKQMKSEGREKEFKEILNNHNINY